MSHPLPLALPPATLPPARRVLRPRTLERTPLQPLLPLDGPEPTAHADPDLQPDVERAARAVTVALAEALAGRRPVGQVEAFADGEVLSTIVHLARSRLAHGLAPRSLRLQTHDRTGVEIALHLGDGARSRACALRLERGRRGWRCVAIEVALTDAGVTRCAA